MFLQNIMVGAGAAGWKPVLRARELSSRVAQPPADSGDEAIICGMGLGCIGPEEKAIQLVTQRITFLR